MLYELHITVNELDRQDDWVALCERLEIKPLLIELHGGGEHPQQLMSASVFEGEDSAAIAWAATLATDVEDAGFTIARIKLEVPLDKSSDYKRPPYHECHVKALLTPFERKRNIPLALSDGWVASRNLLYTHVDGLEKWYFTKRDYDGSYLAAAYDFNMAYTELTNHVWHAIRMESETVIIDTAPELDRGWA